MAPRKNRCNFKECPSAAQRIVGDCGFCRGHFCSKHRLLEDHKCDGLEDVGCPDFDLAQLSAALSTPTRQLCSPARGPQWWLVGLCDTFASDELADLVCSSAKSNPTSEMPRSSKASAPRSLRVYNEDYDDDDDDELASTGSSSPDTTMGGS